MPMTPASPGSTTDSTPATASPPPADSTTRTLYIYLGGYSSSATLTAHLSNSSAADYVATFSGSGKYNQLVTITYSTTAANQQLVLTYLKSGNINGTGGSADLMGAWLGGAPVAPINSASQITTNPQSQSVTAGQTVSFAAAASGTPTPTVQWQVSTMAERRSATSPAQPAPPTASQQQLAKAGTSIKPSSPTR